MYRFIFLFFEVAHFACEIYSVLAVQNFLLIANWTCVLLGHIGKKGGQRENMLRHLKALLSGIAVQCQSDAE